MEQPTNRRVFFWQGCVVLIGLLAAFNMVLERRIGRPKDKVRTSGVTTWTNELVQIATGATNNPPRQKAFDLTNFTGSVFVDHHWNEVTNKPTLPTACALAYKSGVDSGYVLGRIMASRETVRMYVRAYSDPSLADAAAMMAVRDANAATAFRLEEANALSEARKIIQESTNTTNHAP